MDRLVAQFQQVDGDFPEANPELLRLREENRRLRLEACRLRETSEFVLDEPDTVLLAQSLARQFGILVDAASASILVLQDGDAIAEAAWERERIDSVAPRNPAPGGPASDKARRSLQTCVVPLPAGAEIATPIVDHQRRLLGLLRAQTTKEFVSEDLLAAQSFALQAAVGLERARLFDRMRDWTRSLELLLSFNAVINQQIEPAQLVRRLVESAARFLEADGGRTGLAIPSEGSGGTVMISDSYWHRGHWENRAGRWEQGQGIPGFLLESEFPYIANEYQEGPMGDASLIEEYDIRRALCVPIKKMDETLLGFFELLRGPGGPAFTWQDAAFLESLANTTAVAIHNAQLLKALELKSLQIQALSAGHVKRLEAERTHIARELHDEAGQVLIGIKLALQVLSRTVPTEPPQLRDDFDRLRELVNKSTAQLQGLARRLRPPILDQLGLNVALRQTASDFTTRTGIPVECDLDELPQRLPPDTETALYRIAQEALTNVARYASATLVTVRLGHDGDRLGFCVQDDGKGFDLSNVGTGLGLLGMRERADMLGARFEVQTSPNAGTRITVTIPYEHFSDHPR